MKEQDQFKKLLKLLKTNANKFSKVTGVNMSTCYEVANGKRHLSRESLDLIIKAYPNLSLDWFMRGIGEPFLSMPVPLVSDSSITEYTEWTEMDTSDKIRNNIAHNLRAMCDRWRMTQTELYKFLTGEEVTRGQANKLVAGYTSPTMEMLMRMSIYTGRELRELMTTSIAAGDLPEVPLRSTPDAHLNQSDMAEMIADLEKMGKRIARILDKYKKMQQGK